MRSRLSRIAVDYYGAGKWAPVAVTKVAVGNSARWQQFLVVDGPEGDRLLASLKAGPVKPSPRGEAWAIDLSNGHDDQAINRFRHRDARPLP